ncbi:MAG: glycoside hydrolase family 2 [Firmicutes bacterium]|nr:glycoside hydrolase family 2 [Bacillota bacterium]
MNRTSIPRPEYPRPDFIRQSFQNLNGQWDFSFDDDDRGIEEEWYCRADFPREITVPYVYQCALSGIHEKTPHPIVWYRKAVRICPEGEGKRVILHFGAVDYMATVWVNGCMVGSHTGGSTPFAFDITPQVRWGEENTIAVRVFDDPCDLEAPRGKQYWKQESEGIFYTASTGIWQTVWLEQVNPDHLSRIWVTPDVDRKCIGIRMEFAGKSEKQVRVTLKFRGHTYADDILQVANNRCQREFWLDQRISLDWNHQESMVWSPENPVLFDLHFQVLADGVATDAVDSYTALRKVSVVDGKFMLNNRPYYQKMLLDQGYWPTGLITAPSDADYIRDIQACKDMGFNGVRKHQKVEDPRYLYHADRMGLLVWGECPAAYIYSRKSATELTKSWMETVRRDYNHPCILCWVPLNESWGVDGIMHNPEEQAFSRSIYYLTKALDQTRLVISNDGWDHTDSDLLTIHDYSGEYQVLKDRYDGDLENILTSTPGHRTLYAQGSGYGGQPIIVSEFGGIGYRKDAETGWGYTAAVSGEDFAERYRAVVRAVMESRHIQGYVYTQICDVEQEINGLMTYDRKYKIDPKIIREINQSLHYEEQGGKCP